MLFTTFIVRIPASGSAMVTVVVHSISTGGFQVAASVGRNAAMDCF